MKPKTEEFLYFLLWNCDQLMRPTWRNLTGSFEGWAYRNGFFRQIERLRQADFIESRDEGGTERLCRLTSQGRLHALGGRDPHERWTRAWDGKWRLILFDVPLGRDSERSKLRRYLRDKGFGYLQNSVWISPDALADEQSLLQGQKVSVESLILLEARPCGGESDAEIAQGAWDFPAINRRYDKYLEWLEHRPRNALRDAADAKSLRQWAERERSLWLTAVTHDPLLPAMLLPKDYVGRDAWKVRAQMISEVRHQATGFRP